MCLYLGFIFVLGKSLSVIAFLINSQPDSRIRHIQGMRLNRSTISMVTQALLYLSVCWGMFHNSITNHEYILKYGFYLEFENINMYQGLKK